MIPVRGYDGHRVAVLGLGRSGLAAARALAAGGAVPVCWDDRAEARTAATDAGFEVADLTRDAAWHPPEPDPPGDKAGRIVALIVSPGIPHLYPQPHPVVARAMDHGVVVDNDVGLFFRSFATDAWDQMDSPPRVVCVTGSNGKSTTTALIDHCLRSAGRGVQMGGNIGRGVLDLDPPRDGETVVLELSSYQIELARALGPDIAVFLNLSPDHLDRHGGMGGYFAAKQRLFTEGAPERSVVGIDTPEGRYLANRMREEAGTGEPVITIANTAQPKQGWSTFARRGHLAEWRRGRQVASVDLRGIAGLPGTHNHQNACAAWAVLRALGLAPRAIETGLRSYPGLAHRSQIIATRAGVTYVNDSKATNADAAAQSMAAFENLHWIAGGVAKDGGIEPLAPLLGRVAHAYLIGAAAQEFAATLTQTGTPHTITTTLEAAVELAAAQAGAGDTVLLAPACASFDQFDSFEARGTRFADLVAALDTAALPT